MICSSYNEFFKNFSDKTKFKIIISLLNKPLSVNELAEKMGEEQSKISHSLKNLTKCSILKVRQDGKKRIYSLNKSTIVPLMKLVENHVNNHCCASCKMKSNQGGKK